MGTGMDLTEVHKVMKNARIIALKQLVKEGRIKRERADLKEGKIIVEKKIK